MIQISEFRDSYGINRTVCSETFPTITDLVETVSARELSPNLMDYVKESYDFIASDFDISNPSFYGVKTSKEGRDKALFGLAPKSMTKRLKQYRKEIELTQKGPTMCDEFLPIGGILSIPKYLSQSPTPYYVLYEEEQEIKTISIAVDMWTNADISAKKMANACECIMAVLTKLEVQGWSIGLTITNTGEASGKWYSVGAEIKKVSDELEVNRIYQMIGTPIFQRVISWGWRARNPHWVSYHTSSSQPYLTGDDRLRFYQETYQVDKVFRLMDVINELSWSTPERVQDWLAEQLTGN